MEKFENEKYISLDEAAEYLGIKPVTLRFGIRRMKFRHIKLDAFGSLSVQR